MITDIWGTETHVSIRSAAIIVAAADIDVCFSVEVLTWWTGRQRLMCWSMIDMDTSRYETHLPNVLTVHKSPGCPDHGSNLWMKTENALALGSGWQLFVCSMNLNVDPLHKATHQNIANETAVEIRCVESVGRLLNWILLSNFPMNEFKLHS